MEDVKRRVFVTMIPHRIDAKTKRLAPALNISPAAEFGEVDVLMPPRCSIFDTTGISKQLQEKLKDFDNNADVFLPLGDSVLCSLACMILSKRFDYFDVLRWDKNIGRYTKHRVRL